MDSRVLQHKVFDNMGDALAYNGEAGELAYVKGRPSEVNLPGYSQFLMGYSGGKASGRPVGGVPIDGALHIFYVDATNGVDNVDTDRGWSADKPWKTFGYAYDWVARFVNVGAAPTITFHLAPGDYNIGRIWRGGIGTSRVVIDGTNDSGEVTLTGTGDEHNTAFLEGTCCFRHGEFLFRKIKFLPSGNTSLTLADHSTVWLFDCTIKCVRNGEIPSRSLHVTDQTLVRIYNTLTLDLEGLTELPSTGYKPLLGAGWSAAIYFGEGDGTLICKNFPSTDNSGKNSFFIACAAEGSLIGLASSGKWTVDGITINDTEPFYFGQGYSGGVFSTTVYDDKHTLHHQSYTSYDSPGFRNVTFKEFFGPYEAIAVAARVVNYEEDTAVGITPSDNLDGMWNEIDTEYRRVGILSKED